MADIITIIQNVFSSLKPHTNELIQKLFAWKNIFIDHIFIIIQNFFTSFKPRTNKLIQKLSTWNNIIIDYANSLNLSDLFISIQHLFKRFKLLVSFLSF